jgi:Arc/MetJ-type ribon-helix-helix transcriptional regulator
MRYGETVRVRVPAEIAAWVRQRAEQEGRTISEIVREAVDAYLSETSPQSESSPQEDEDAEDDSASLAIRLTSDQRAALRARGNLERLIRCALRAYHAAPPPPKRAPSAAVGPSNHNYFVRLTKDMRAGVRRQAARYRTSEAAIIRFALQCAAK